MHGPVTVMSVKGQSHLSFLPQRINNVVILAETGVSVPRVGSPSFSGLLSPEGPSCSLTVSS